MLKPPSAMLPRALRTLRLLLLHQTACLPSIPHLLASCSSLIVRSMSCRIASSSSHTWSGAIPPGIAQHVGVHMLTRALVQLWTSRSPPQHSCFYCGLACLPCPAGRPTFAQATAHAPAHGVEPQANGPCSPHSVLKPAQRRHRRITYAQQCPSLTLAQGPGLPHACHGRMIHAALLASNHMAAQGAHLTSLGYR